MADATRRDDGPAPTRRDGAGADPTRLDAGATRVDATAPTRHEDAASASPSRSLFNLPRALDARFLVVEPLKTAGAEAELLIVEAKADKQRAVAKIYRPGIAPKTDVLDRIARMAPQFVVRLLEHGTSDGFSYELLEYCRFGSLRRFLRGRPLPPDWARRILQEIYEALAHLHGIEIIHRDLKPENVLIRATAPLDLVLADFGIASIADASQHFTTASRTVKYAAPEAASGVISPKADYWSLGMIMVEALTGHHPFDGLSEPVINQRLATRPVDVSSVSDEHWRMLCRGLLHRNPEERWDADAVGRWLRGDSTLAAAFDDASLRPAAEVTPYQLDDETCVTGQELAVALAKHWQIGIKDLARGFIAAWFRDELRDLNLSRFVLDLADNSSLTPDGRLLRLIVKLAPGLPPIWRGEPLTQDNLLALAARAAAGDGKTVQWLDELIEQKVLSVYAQTGAAPLAELERNWNASVAAAQAQLAQLLDREKQMEEEIARRRRAGDGPADMDELMFGRGDLPNSGPRVLNADTLLCLLGDNYEAVLRNQVLARGVALAADCGWLALFGPVESLSRAQLLAMKSALPRADAYAKRARERREEQQQREIQLVRSFCGEVDAVVVEMRMLEHANFGDDENTSRETLELLVRQFRNLDAQAAGMNTATPEGQRMRNSMLKIRMVVDDMDRQLAHMRNWLLRGGVAGGGSSLFAAIFFVATGLPAWLLIPIVIVAAAAFCWFGWLRWHAAGELRRLIRHLPLASGALAG